MVANPKNAYQQYLAIMTHSGNVVEAVMPTPIVEKDKNNVKYDKGVVNVDDSDDIVVNVGGETLRIPESDEKRES